MRMDLGRRSDYAIRCVLHLARQDDGRRLKAREIARQAGVPKQYAAQILAALVRAGLVASLAGRDGGYVLARRAEDVSLLDVIESVDGPIDATTCVLRSGPCGGADICDVHVSWSEAQAAFREKLAEADLASIAAVRA